ncbi:TPA: hypothetical protein ACGR5M_004678 [Escherichia coli]
MDGKIKALLNQVRILEEEANKHSGAERAELFKAAAKVKMEVIKLLPKQGQQQQQESKIPDPTTYFGAKLPEGFENYFSGDYLTPEMESYFTVQVPDNVPDAPKSTETPKSYDMDPEIRRKILNAIGIPC